MQINAIYDNGSLLFQDSIQFKHARFSVTIEIPDHELDTINKQEQREFQSLTTSKPASTIRKQLDKILGNYAYKRPAISASKDKAVWHQHLENKYL